MTRVKICGVTRLEDALLAASLGASAIGLVFWPRSPRLVPADVARAISRRLPSFVARVGVFVDASPDEVRAVVARVGLDVVQLHGDEDARRYDDVGARLLEIFAMAEERGVSTEAAAEVVAEQRMASVGRLRGFWLPRG